MRLGFVGLGNMGGPMCRNLLAAGHDVAVHDARRAAASEAERMGAAWAATSAEAGTGRDVVITMLPTPRHVESVLLGPGGLLDALDRDAVWVDMSTSVPAVADRVREVAAGRGVHVLDAPVSGMAAGAHAGTLQIFVGGEPEVYERVRPVFDVLGDPGRVMRVGGHGAGYTVKLMVNLLWFAHLVATCEVLSIGTSSGVEVGVLRDALLSSPAASTFLERDVLSVLRDGDYDDSFALALACKDLALANDLAREVKVPAELAALVEQIYRRARRSHGDLAGQMTPIKLWEDLMEVPLRLAPEGA